LVEEYRREAEYAMKMAEEAPTEDMRASWLRLAGKWLAMVPSQPSTGAFQTTLSGYHRINAKPSH